MLDIPFNEAVYTEMAKFFQERTSQDALLFGMTMPWEERFRKDFADVAFETAGKKQEMPETWRERFSMIVLAPGIEELSEPECLLEFLQTFLTSDGSVLVPFRNPCHWSVFQSHFAGELRYGANPLLKGQGRLFSFEEIVRLAKLAHYEGLTVRMLMEEGEPELLRLLGECGVGNEKRAPEVSWWILRLTVIPLHIVRLKARYTEEERRLLARLLHRLENGIEEMATVEALRQLLIRSGMDGKYLEAFVRSVAADAAALFDRLKKEGLFG